MPIAEATQHSEGRLRQHFGGFVITGIAAFDDGDGFVATSFADDGDFKPALGSLRRRRAGTRRETVEQPTAKRSPTHQEHDEADKRQQADHS